MCLELSLQRGNERFENIVSDVNMCSKIVWDDGFASVYLDNLSKKFGETHICDMLLETDFDIHGVTECLTSCLIDAGSFLKKTIVGRNSARKNPWYDKECFTLKRKLQRMLRRCLRSTSTADRNDYTSCRNTFNKLIKEKKRPIGNLRPVN